MTHNQQIGLQPGEGCCYIIEIIITNYRLGHILQVEG